MNLRFDALPAEWRDEMPTLPGPSCDLCGHTGPIGCYEEEANEDGTIPTVYACTDRDGCYQRFMDMETPQTAQPASIAA